VVDRKDPQKLGRVRVTVGDAAGQMVLAWARVASAVGGDGSGVVAVPPEGAFVVVAFEADDPNRPLVLGAGWMAPGASQVPLAAQGLPDPVREPRGLDTATGAGGSTIAEPEDPSNPTYPDNFVFKSPKAGHLVEVDDTGGAERIAVTHGPSKTRIEIHPDGHLVIGISGRRYTLVEGDSAEHVKGRSDVVVDDEATVKAGAKLRLEGRGLRVRSTAEGQFVITGDFSLRGQSVLVESLSDANYKAPGTSSIGPGTNPAPVVTGGPNGSHLDYITGLPLLGVPSVLAG
jgi:hypothetical protein